MYELGDWEPDANEVERGLSEGRYVANMVDGKGTSLPARIARRCTYKCIDTYKRRPYALVVATRLCDLSGMNRKTGKTFASTMFALKRPCSFSMIPMLLPNATSLLRMRSGG
jgi:hypothetical protein